MPPCPRNSTRHHDLAAELFGPTGHPGAPCALRPRRPVLWQRIPRPVAPARRRAYAEPSWRVLRQRAGRKPDKGFGRPWSRLKTEVLELRKWPVFAGLAAAQASVADYPDYYNRHRLHPSIRYQPPYRNY
ncbi:integrase core domain-containing protein [Hymenobacter humi]|uniref:Integrase core domain-containing protein n=1 Tax=Hymenobacter humi TaxID=1411620 RepID=A0ABW2U2G3_9BACT